MYKKKSQRDTILETIKVTNGTYRKMFKKTRAPTEQNTKYYGRQHEVLASPHRNNDRDTPDIATHNAFDFFFVLLVLVTNSAQQLPI